MELELPSFGGGDRKPPWPLIAVGVVALFVLLGRRGSGAPSGGGPSFSEALEFRRAAAAAEGDMRALTATNDLRRYELDLAHRNTPAGLRECYTGEQWRSLDRTAKDLIRHQAKRGGSAITPGPGGGVCVVPSGRGLDGDLQTVQSGKSGLFGGSSRGVGTSAPPTPRAGILDAFDAYLRSQSGGGYYGR